MIEPHHLTQIIEPAVIAAIKKAFELKNLELSESELSELSNITKKTIQDTIDKIDFPINYKIIV